MPSKPTFSLRVLLDAVRRRVDETSIRAVATEIGMSPSGLHVLLSGTKPHPGTRKKLILWYVERRRAPTGISADDVDAAVQLLGHYIRDETRADMQKNRLREVVRRLEAEAIAAKA